MALVNRTTGETSRTEAQRALSTSLSVPQTSTPPQNSLPSETENLIISWATITRMNQEHSENTLLKQTLCELRQEMNALEEKQMEQSIRLEETAKNLHCSVNACEMLVRKLENSNQQLQNGIDEAMNKGGEQIKTDTKDMLGQAQRDLAAQSKKYINHLERITNEAKNTFKNTESVIHVFMNDHQGLWYVFLATLVCQIVNTINWIAGFF